MPAAVATLVERFERNRAFFRSSAYNETQLRREFLDPFFHALGWDVANTSGTADAYKDVVHEDSIKVGGATKAPDYSFRTGGTRRFFVEAKRPSLDLKQDPKPSFQLRRYAWSAKLPLSLLTDFEELSVYDGRVEPRQDDRSDRARIAYFRFTDYEEHWQFLSGTFSKQAVLDGSFDAYARAATTKRGAETVDAAFLREIESWRTSLAAALVTAHTLSQHELNLAVQRTIDRIIFLRICEDRGIEPYGQLQAAARSPNVYGDLLRLFRNADARYNSGLFYFEREAGRDEAVDTLTPTLRLSNDVLEPILGRLYYPDSPYEFSVLPADILGQAYEQFLGRLIVTTPDGIAVEEKPAVKKAGGVYYTPTFVVDYIVGRTVGALVDGRRPLDLWGRRRRRRLRILDPACGSGSFLIAAYQYLLDWYRERYVAEGPERWAKGRRPTLYRAATGEWRLTGHERQRILLDHVFGVDIDAQAVEVTKLSLLLKVLEGESLETLDQQMTFLHQRALPDLGNNIRCGNSLIGPDYYQRFPETLEDDAALYRVNAFDWASELVSTDGVDDFDVVLGNPPYVLLQDGQEDPQELRYFRERYSVASYKVDTYHLFVEKGLELTQGGGMLSMITPANFLTNNYLSGLRRALIERSLVERVDVIDGGVFEGIAVDNAIFVVRGGASTTTSFPVTGCEIEAGAIHERSTTLVDPERALETRHVLFTGSREAGAAELWQRLEAEAQPLGRIAHVSFGKQLRDRRAFPTDVVTLGADDEQPVTHRRCYTGRNVNRYVARWGGLACLDDREARRGGTWDDEKQNAVDKLLTRQIGRSPEWAIDQLGYQCLNTMFMVNVFDASYDPYYLLGVLNSSLLRAFWLDRYFDRRRTFPKIKGTYLKELPIWPASDASTTGHRAAIANAASGIVETLQRPAPVEERELSARRAAVRAHELAIDRLTNELYGLSAADVALVSSVLADAG